MKRYFVQLDDCQHPFEVLADDNPTLSEGWWEFRRDGQVVGRFVSAIVKGWWHNDT